VKWHSIDGEDDKFVGKQQSAESMSREKLITLLEQTINRLCVDCRNEIPFNMAGGHSFDIHARSCKAAELRTAVKELKEKQNAD